MGHEKIVLRGNPSLTESLKIVKDGLAQRRTVMVIGSCRVRYEGRASSTLQEGERILIVKDDGNLLIHRPYDLEPVNYMPSANRDEQDKLPTPRKAGGCLFEATSDGESLTIRAVRKEKRESISATFSRIYAVMGLDLVDRATFSLYASEEDMRRAILVEPALVEQGFRPTSFERRVEPGFVDVYGSDSEGRLVVIEIKRNAAGKDSALQLARYVESIRAQVTGTVRGILVAPGLARGVQPLLASLSLEFKPLSPRKAFEVLKSRGLVEQHELSAWF